ncbi:Hypothetical protein A7982_10563 [Minicystis rosea]|nr:Hypothetical protein A7982_10563 [Minicystis rosea]
MVDADGDGKPDLLAWARAPDGLRGELWFASGKSPAEGRLVAALPADLTAPGCSAHATLSLIGPRTAAFDFEPRCPARIRERATRWIALSRFVAGPPEIALEIRAGAPADGETLAIALDARDRDGDGRADIGVTFTLTGAPHPLPGGGSAAASLAFFDRPAGLSRDPTEPEASIKAIGAALLADGRKKTTSPRVPAAAGAARRLHALLCEDGGGKPIISTTAGPIRCATERIAEESAIAEVEAGLNLGDPVTAFAALGRLDASGQRRKDVDALVAKSVSTIAGTLVRTTAAIPDPPRASGFSPLAFDADGSLLVRTADRVVRVDKTSFAESAADAALMWPKELQWPVDAPTWSLGRVDDDCETSTAVARFGYAGAVTTVPLPIPTPPRCALGGASPPVDLLGASTQGLLFAYRGEIVAIPATAPPRVVPAESFAPAPGVPVDRGTARSPNGGTIAVTTSRGVLVSVLKGSARGGSAKLWTSPLIDGGKACVPSDGGERLACVVSKGAAIYDVK